MHLPNCHPRHRAFALTSSATLAPILGGAQFNGCIREEKLYNRGLTLKSTNLQTALLPLLPWLVPFCSPKSCKKPSFRCYLGWRRPARTQRSCSGNKYGRAWHNCADVQSDQWNVECEFHLLGRSDQHSHRSRAAILLHLLPAVVYGPENLKLSGGPGAVATAVREPKKIGGVLHIPAGGDDLTFQRQTAVSSSSLGRPCKGSYHTVAKLNQPDLHVLLVFSNGRMSWGRWWNQLIRDLYRFIYNGDQMISWWRMWPSTSKSTGILPAWPRRMLLFGFAQADDRSNWPLTPRDVHLFKIICKLWLACVYLSKSHFGAIQKGVCVCHWRPAGLHAHVPLVKDISSQQVKNENNLQQEDESVVELDFVQKKKKTNTTLN